MLGILAGFTFIRIFSDDIDLACFCKSSNFCLCASREKPFTCIKVETRVYMYAFSMDGTFFILFCQQ